MIRGSLGDLSFAQLPRTLGIHQIVRETKTVSTFVLDTPLRAEPGQFLMVWVPGVDEKPISIAWPDPLAITVARVGEWSAALHERRAGDFIGVRGPYGRPYRIAPGRAALLVGGGYGAAPLYYLASALKVNDQPVTVALGARRADDLIYVDRFQKLGAELLLATEDGSTGAQGYVTVVVEDYLTKRLHDFPTVYACGPEGMLVALHRLSRERGVPAQLSVERYMKCGFGICGQCALDDLLTCIDGPVLDAEQLDGKQDFGRFHRTATGRRMPVS
ncbi:MAG TPA: dihydroorotate dehydrogenase electron transfer subunit [Anaerolineae bacterium]|nr:dihydroorotate dehydrogenase electron transfer subunit [Anaerolineae bacterium]